MKKKMTRKIDLKLRVGKPPRKMRLTKHVGKYRNYNWKQAKKKFPMLSARGDVDFDGTMNSRDCKPLDPARDGLFGRALGVLTRDKYGQSKAEYQAERVVKITSRPRRRAEKESKQVIRITGRPRRRALRVRRIKKAVEITRRTPIIFKRRMVRKALAPEHRRAGRTVERLSKQIATGKSTVAAGKGKKGKVGRPRGSFKHRDPRTGAPLPATQYYKIKRRLKSQTAMTAEQVAIRNRIMLARRGVSPEMAQEIERRRQLAILQQQQVPSQPTPLQQVQYPQQQQQFRVVTDIMTGRKMIKPIPGREKWTQA